jgi:Ca-activated chloride channel family protein
MSFAWPLLLWLLLVPAALLAWELSRRRRLEANPHPKMLRAQAEFQRLALITKPSATRRARVWLCLGLAFGVVARARPQWGRTEEQVFDQSREILLAVDLSRSMQAQDVKPSRLDRAKLLIQSLLERLEGERVGLIVFSGTAFLQSPLSADYEILREFLPALGPDYLPEGGTNYRALIDTALQAFGSSSAADRFLIVLSDGEATDDNWKEKIDDLTKRGIRVIGLGIGTAGGAMIPDNAGNFVKDERGAVVLSRLESGTLQELTKATSGVYRDASTWLDLAGLIRETVEAGRKGAFTEKNQVRMVERFQWALAPALLCLLLSFWREFPVLPKPRELTLGKVGTGVPARPGPTPTPNAEPPVLSSASTVVRSLLIFALLASGLAPFSSHSTPLVASARAAIVKAPSLSSPAAKSSAPAPGPAPTAPAAGAPEALVAPLSNLTKELAASEHVPAGDWNRFVTTTLDYAQRRTRAQEPVAQKAISDGLDACDAGEALDPKAADWDSLRRQLRQYQDQKDQKKDDQKQQDQKKDQQKQDQQKQDDQNQDQQKQDQDKQKQDQQKKDQQKKDDQSSKQDSPPEDQKDPSDKKDQQSAFGDMKDQPPTPPPPSNETQKVGGAPEKKEGEPKDADPSLALPLQKLDQLKNQDSPAKLYQLMDGEKKSDSKKKGKDW